MIRTQVSLTEDQMRRLRAEARRRRTSIAAVVRSAVDRAVPPDELQERWRLAMEVVGSYRSGYTDLAERHDEHLGDALYEEYLEKRG